MSPARPPCWLLAAAFALALAAGPLSADPPTAVPDAAPKPFFERDSPLPDPGGFRAKLADRGIAFGLLYTGEVFGNPAGGYRQGAVYDGLVTSGLDVDLEKLAHLTGVKFHALAYYAHGPSGTDKYTRDLNRFSNIDAFDSVRLFELWLETSLFQNVVNLRAGQIAADAEFATTQGGALLIHPNFGALPILTLNVPSPIYPQAAPGVRLRLNSPDTRFYFQTGLYAGNPNADRDGDPAPGFRAGTAYNDHGVRFPVSGNQGALAIFETGFLLNLGKEDRGLPGSYRVGGFYHTGTFSDQRLDPNGRSLADPLSDGRPRAHHGDGGFYAAADQVLYRAAGPGGGNNVRENVAQTASAPVNNASDAALTAAGTGTPSGPELRVFGRAGFAPEDRGQAGFYLETGLNYRSLLPGRGQDVLGVGFTYTDLSGDLRRAVREANRFHGTHDALPDYERLLELTYQANIAPWLSVQPDLQYLVHPGGTSRYGNALILGTRTVVTF